MDLMTDERRTWSDERLDDLSKRMDEGFHRNDVEHAELRREMKAGFDSMNARLDASTERISARLDASNDGVNARFDASNEGINARFDKLQQTLMVIGGGLIGTLIAATVSVIVFA